MKSAILSLGLYLLGSTNAHAGDPKAVHGMLLFGHTKTYISHLPMFHNPHDYQWVAEVELPPSVNAVYGKNGDGLFTLVPEPFVLPDVAQGQVPFMATLFKGHFEKDGTPITEKFQVKITHNLIFKKFNPSAEQPNHFKGFAIGGPLEKYIVHSIVKAPDFDQVIQIEAGASTLKFLKEGMAFPISIETTDFLVPNTKVLVNPGTRTAEEVELLNDVYFEKDELQG